MKISDLEKLGCHSLTAFEDTEVVTAYTSDLLSDVMANAPEDSVLITLQAHKNTVACATLAGVLVIVLAGHRHAPADMIEAAQAEKIALFGSDDNQFHLSWKIAGLLGLK